MYFLSQGAYSKMNKHEFKNKMASFGEKEETSKDELCTISDVAVPPVVVKQEKLDDQCVGDILLTHFPNQYLDNSDMTQEIDIKEEIDVPSCLEIKLEVKDEILNDETVSSDYCEDDFMKWSGTVEIKSESICNVLEFDINNENPIKTSLDVEKLEDDTSKQFALKKKKDILGYGAEKSTDQWDENEELNCWNENQAKKETICVMELISTPNSIEELGYNNAAVDETSGFSNLGVDPKMEENGVKSNSFSYICSNCNVVFSSKTLYEQYLLSSTEHTNKDLPSNTHSNNDLEEDEPKTCIVLKQNLLNFGKVTVNCEQQLQKWNQISSQKISSSCPNCTKPFSEENEFLKSATEERQKLFRCGSCEKSYFFKSSLTKHMRTHSAEESCVCGICNKSFSNKSLLKEHMYSHPSKPFSCYKSLPFKTDLSVRENAGQKLYVCNICKRAFTVPSRLHIHMEYTHGKKTSFQCALCLKSYSNKSNLKRHLQIHSGKNPDI